MQLPGRYEMFNIFQIPFNFLHFLDPVLMVK